jgi:hypothetical protein
MIRTKYNNPTPKQAVLAFCRQCVPNVKERENCKGDKLLDGTSCPLYPYRMGKGRPPVQKIRKTCLYCMNGQSKLVNDCPGIDCPLYPFRFGTNPNREGVGFKSSSKT